MRCKCCPPGDIRRRLVMFFDLRGVDQLARTREPVEVELSYTGVPCVFKQLAFDLGQPAKPKNFQRVTNGPRNHDVIAFSVSLPV